MSREGDHDGYPGINPTQAEFGDAGLLPVTPETLDGIRADMRRVAALAYRHPIAELAFQDSIYLVHIKKHLELGHTSDDGDVIEYPSAEISVHEGEFGENPERYTVWPDGKIGQRDGVLVPFRFLPPPKADALAEHLLYGLGEDVPDGYRPGVLIKAVLDIAAAKGAKANEVSDSLLVKGMGPVGANNGEIDFEFVERSWVLPELESAPEMMFSIKMETPQGAREYDGVKILENGTALYELRDYGGAGPAEPREEPETFEEKVARRQTNEEWQAIAHAMGLDLMTEEQARRVSGRLKLVLPRIKWDVAYPNQANSDQSRS